MADFPEAVGYLENLRVLNLAHNHFAQQLPTGLGECASLHEVWLNENCFTGECSGRGK